MQLRAAAWYLAWESPPPSSVEAERHILESVMNDTDAPWHEGPDDVALQPYAGERRQSLSPPLLLFPARQEMHASAPGSRSGTEDGAA